MTSSLSSIIDNLVEGLHKDKCKDWKFALEYALAFKSVNCSIRDEKEFDKDLTKRSESSIKFWEREMNKVFTILQKFHRP